MNTRKDADSKCLSTSSTFQEVGLEHKSIEQHTGLGQLSKSTDPQAALKFREKKLLLSFQNNGKLLRLAGEDHWSERGVKKAIHVKLGKPSLNKP